MSKFDIGAFRDRAELVRYRKTETGYAWERVRTLWSIAERQSGKNLFSAVGLGAESWRFTVRMQDLSVEDAIRYAGHHHFLTSVQDEERGFLRVDSARVQVAACACHGMAFEAAITEKYVQFQQQTPQSENHILYVLVTPKVIELTPGDYLTVDGHDYSIQLKHELDPVKNEYEIRRVEDL
nr:MAG TPA: head-tail joining protein [Caudoviricetes sp.]